MTGPRALAGVMFAAATALAAGAASAQVPYQIGNYSGSVTVDNGVLESLGPTPTVPQMLRPGTPVGEYGYDPRMGSLAAVESSRGSHGSASRIAVPGSGSPTLGIDGAPAPDWLRRPDAPRYAPLPETLSKPAPAAPRASAPAPKPAAAAPAASRVPAPAPAQRTAEPAPRTAPPSTPTVAKVVAPTPPPPPKPAAPVAAAPAPKAAAPTAAATAAPLPPRLPPRLPPAASAPPPATQEPPKREAPAQVAAASPPPAAPPPPAPSAQGAGGDLVRVPFEANQTTLASGPRPDLDALVARLRKDETLRVQLLAYADGDEDNANKARRLSLSRALAVRAYLIDKQIQSTRMDVRALGNRTKDTPKDRVDVVLVSR